MLSSFFRFFDLQKDLLRPYFSARHTSYDSDYALIRAKFQIDHLLREVIPELERKIPGLEPDEIPDWLGRKNARAALYRIKEMLEHLESAMSVSDARGDQRIHQALYFGPAGNPRMATTPALLAIHAILYSHTRWGEQYFHDLQSGMAASALLSHFPDFIRRILASLVTWKNVFRTSASQQEYLREVGVLHNGDLVFERDRIAELLASVLRREWTPAKDDAAPPESITTWQRGLVKALYLTAMAYQARTGKQDESAIFTEFESKLLSCFDSREDETSNATLVVFEFSRYVFDEKNCQQRKTLMHRLIPNEQQHYPNVRWISFGRYWSLHHGTQIGRMASSEFDGCFHDWDGQGQFNCLPSNIECDFTILDLDFDPENENKTDHKRHQDAAFQVAFGGPQPDDSNSIWDRVATALALFSGDPDSSHEFCTLMSWAYVMRVLEILSHIYPTHFLAIGIGRPRPCSEDAGVPCENWIHLPREIVSHVHLKNAIEQEDWPDPRLLVARAFSVLLINQRIAYGNMRQHLRLKDTEDNDATRALVVDWLRLANTIADQDGHKKLQTYLKVYNTPPFEPAQPPFPRHRPAGDYLMGVDIGGSSVKLGIYRFSFTNADLAFTAVQKHYNPRI